VLSMRRCKPAHAEQIPAHAEQIPAHAEQMVNAFGAAR
jgi:hypothetical protein